MTMRNKKTFQDTNILILCEGTDTEVNYFKSIRSQVLANSYKFSVIKIVPILKEDEFAHNKNRHVKIRKFKNEEQPYHYYEMEESDKDTYDNFKVQPLRYVREAYLFMRYEGFVEAWAVYDKDAHPAHKEAADYAKKVNVGIAFSSLCFEEWILCHFERNEHAFTKSVCKTPEGKDRMCGTGSNSDDCHGGVCLGGRIREMGFIPEYSKTKQRLYEDILQKKTKTACINASWTRTLNDSSDFFDCNPYTSVDRLVTHLLSIEEIYLWAKNGDEIPLQKSQVLLTFNKNEIEIKNTGSSSIILKPETIYFVDENLGHINDAITKTILLSDGKNINISIGESSKILVLKDLKRYTFIDITL